MATTPPLPHIPQGAAQVALPPNRLSEPTIYPKFATRLGSLNCLRPKYYHGKVESPIFFWWKNHQTRPPRRHLTFLASRPNMIRLLWQCMVLPRRHGIYMYMYLKSRTQTSCSCIYQLVIHNIATEMPVLEGNSQKVA